jgi:hypothetical protein
MKHLAKLIISGAAVCLLTPSCVPPEYRNSPENAAKLAPKPSVVIDKPIVVSRFESGEPKVTIPPGVYTPHRRMNGGTVYTSKDGRVHNAMMGRKQVGGILWTDGAGHPEAYCLFFYDPMGTSGWEATPTDALRHIAR